MLASKGDSKMSHRRAKTTGWAAFDQKQRQKDSCEARPSNELFPSLPSIHQPAYSRNNHLKVKSFSSVILPAVDFLDPLHDNMKSKPSAAGSSEGPQINKISQDGKIGLVYREYRQLKELFAWADESLIEDIMAAAGNDFDKASSFLKAMVSNQSSEEPMNVEMENYSCDSMKLVSNGKLMHENKDGFLNEIFEPSKMCFAMEPCVGNSTENVMNEFTLSAEQLLNDCTEINKLMGQLTCVPLEPEWEEDDVYLTRRKDAINMMRAATRHSKAATNSFLRGDHISSQQFSLQARKEWRAAQSLNAKAACEILSIRNENNGIWRLDLHGLHASEAVQAVKERLDIIETQLLFEGPKPSEIPNSLRTKAEVWRASCPDGYILEKSNEQASHKLKPIWLEVITGIGNHSRGGATLPTAVRTFLSENGYHFDEARPGLIMVRPKFRPVK